MKRNICVLVALLLQASVSRAGVHLAVRPDGTKVIYNDEVDSRRYRPVLRSDAWLAQRLNRPSAYDGLIREAALAHEMDPQLVKSVMLVESGFNPAARSRKGALGLMQLMPATARMYGVRNALDARDNVFGGTRYLTYLLNLYKGDLESTLAAYNAGEGAVEKYGGIPPYDETLLYVHKTLTAYYGKAYLGGGFGRAFTSRYRLLADLSPGNPVHIARDADNRPILTTGDPAAALRRR
ncbi:MAG: lytic transglycosylase domain-containing protein [Thermoanaerobaculia bacterium]